MLLITLGSDSGKYGDLHSLIYKNYTVIEKIKC